jgi:hypothetical protein
LVCGLEFERFDGDDNVLTGLGLLLDAMKLT